MKRYLFITFICAATLAAAAYETVDDLFARAEEADHLRDQETAAELYRRAADRGYACAQISLSYCYQTGFGVPKDTTRAAYWYAKAAEQGDRVALKLLIEFYQSGSLVQRNAAKAVQWFRKAEQMGFLDGGYFQCDGEHQEYVVSLYRSSDTESGMTMTTL